nr:DUF2235 domain-containing protein [Pseudaestuariivita rosea]
MREQILQLIRQRPWIERHSTGGHPDGSVTHVIILDGTLSSLSEGHETNVGLAYKLLKRQLPNRFLSIYYEAGLQWYDVKSGFEALTGKGIDTQIKRAYGVLASNYRPGDRIFLIGYSRGAFAVRSLAGMIERVGLVRPEFATVRHIRQAYRHYRRSTITPASASFTRAHCYPNTPIAAIGAWDTVKALGLNFPILRNLGQQKHQFHNHRLGNNVECGFQALAMNETRQVFEPVMWERCGRFGPKITQMWFDGVHGDIGGQVGHFQAARPRSNISFVWVMEQLQNSGLPLPLNWQDEFPQDITAPSVGTFRRGGMIMIRRRDRIVGRYPTEQLHPTVQHISDVEPLNHAAE